MPADGPPMFIRVQIVPAQDVLHELPKYRVFLRKENTQHVLTVQYGDKQDAKDVLTCRVVSNPDSP